MPSSTAVRRSQEALPVAAALLALALSAVLPLASPLLVALVIGAIVANALTHRRDRLKPQEESAKLMLRLGVALLGLRLPLDDIVAIGWAGFVIIVVTVVVTFAATRWLGARASLDPGLVTLIAMGFSICGAAAIAAVNDAVRARQRDTAIAVALVTIFGTAMIAIVPWLSTALSLTNEQAAIWAGASIHEVAQVAAAASLVGGAALTTAMTVKLGRVVLLLPMYVLAVRNVDTPEEGAKGTPSVPWFLVAFGLMVALRSTRLLPTAVIDVADAATALLLAAGMYGLGVGLQIRSLWPVPRAALMLALASTVTAASTSLALVWLLA